MLGLHTVHQSRVSAVRRFKTIGHAFIGILIAQPIELIHKYWICFRFVLRFPVIFGSGWICREEMLNDVNAVGDVESYFSSTFVDKLRREIEDN